jgi:ribosomal-protein-alanine N-acetyltransferase
MRGQDFDMPELKIRPAEEKDIEGIAKLEAATFKRHWSTEAVYKDVLENNKSIYLIAEIDGDVIGYLAAWHIVGECQILNLAVIPELRRRGLGSTLLELFLNAIDKVGIKECGLEVRKSNEAAIALYEKFGFKKDSVRTEYYTDECEDAIIMWRTLE